MLSRKNERQTEIQIHTGWYNEMILVVLDLQEMFVYKSYLTSPIFVAI